MMPEMAFVFGESSQTCDRIKTPYLLLNKEILGVKSLPLNSGGITSMSPRQGNKAISICTGLKKGVSVGGKELYCIG